MGRWWLGIYSTESDYNKNKHTGKKDKKIFHSLGTKDRTEAEQKQIYFDKKYDDTRYDILDEMAHLKYMDDAIKKKSILKSHLINTIGLVEEDAERDAESMINKKKKVIEGEYAMVDNGEFQFRYYQRKNKKWVLDDTLNDLAPEELNFVNCNFKNKCMTINEKCLNINNQKGKLQE